MRVSRPVSLRLIEKIIPTENGCWEWTGCKNKQGYGSISIGHGKNSLAHRASYKAFIGPIPDGLYVCHTCDNPPCINPSHLFLGTNSDNQLDSIRKGRHGNRSRENNGRAKLNWDKVREIRASYKKNIVSSPKLARKYGVSKSCIQFIVNNINWKE